jgi:hypothetical protein
VTAEQRTWTVDAPDAGQATEQAKRLARQAGLRVVTVAACRPSFASVDRETGLPNRWDVRLSVEAVA